MHNSICSDVSRDPDCTQRIARDARLRLDGRLDVGAVVSVQRRHARDDLDISSLGVVARGEGKGRKEEVEGRFF